MPQAVFQNFKSWMNYFGFSCLISFICITNALTVSEDTLVEVINLFFFIVIVANFHCLTPFVTIQTKAWNIQDSKGDWPEFGHRSVNNKENTGIAFSGGGARAFTSGIGVSFKHHGRVWRGSNGLNFIQSSPSMLLFHFNASIPVFGRIEPAGTIREYTLYIWCQRWGMGYRCIYLFIHRVRFYWSHQHKPLTLYWRRFH